MALLESLRAAGCDVHAAANNVAGLERINTLRPDVVLLPQSLPDEDPLELCRAIRLHTRDTQPVFVLTPPPTNQPSEEAEAASDRSSRQTAIPAETSVATFFRAVADCRIHGREPDDLVLCDGLTMDLPRHRAIVDGKDVGLTPTEFRLLWTLASKPGRVFTRQQLTQASCGGGSRTRVRTIDAHVKSIRQKLDQRAYLVETVHGVGYRFHEQDG
jgi:two-component system phosphate regulon response regulator PhoB